MCLLVLGLDLMFCRESLNEVYIISTERVAILPSFHPGLFLYFLDCKINN